MSLMQLRQIHIDRFLVEAYKDHERSKEGASSKHTATIAELAKSNADASLWKVALHIRTVKKPNKPSPPYKIDIQMSGIFATEPEGIDGLDGLQLAQLIGVNGASILHSAAREHVFLVTARGTWGSYQLPTVSFANLEVTSLDSSDSNDAAIAAEEDAGSSQ